MENEINVFKLYEALKEPGVQIKVYGSGVMLLTFPNDQNILKRHKAYIYVLEEIADTVSITTELSILFLQMDHTMIVDQVSVYPTLLNGGMSQIEIFIKGREPRENGLGGTRGNLKWVIDDLDTECFVPDSAIFAVGNTYQEVISYVD